MRIMTCNIWGDYFHNPVKDRMGGYETLFSEYKPDIVGFQECTAGWYGSGFFEAIEKDYSLYRLIDKNYTPILVRKERFSLLSCGFRLYSRTPDASKGYTYLVLKDNATDKALGVINTHFWWKVGEEHDRIREENARELGLCARNIVAAFGCPVYAFGDLNCRYHESPFRILASEGFLRTIDSAREADEMSSHHGDPVLGEDGKWHGRKTENDKNHSLDHILFMNGTESIFRYRVVCDPYILDSSDHSPVYIDIAE